MKVLMIGPGFPPARGGVETHLGEIAGAMGRQGVDVEVWVPDRTVPTITSSRSGAALVRRFPARGPAQFPFSPALLVFAGNHFPVVDIVHAHSYHTLAASAAMRAPSRAAIVFTPHFHGGGHTALARLLHAPYRMALGTRLFTRADRIIAVSRAEQELICKHFPEVAAKISVIHNAAATEAIRAADPWPDEPPTLLVLGRLEGYKRVDRTLEAFGRTTVHGQLVIIGDGPDRSRIEALVAANPRSTAIRLLGQVADPSVHRWLRTCRALVSMSEHEAFGLVAVEAAAGGARALLSDLPAHREVRELLPPGAVTLIPDVAGLPTEMDLVLRATPPLASSGRTLADVRSWADAAAEHVELFEAVLAETARDESRSPAC